jgi:protein gp37
VSDHSSIEWTDATWNPTTGCTKVSPGCAHCYIERTPPFRAKHRRFVSGHIPLQLHADRLEQPLHWRQPRRIFVNSLSDLFHDEIPDQFLHDVYHVMEQAHWHTFQVLTKRARRMCEYLNWRYGQRDDGGGCRIPARHLWHGVSVENQYFANERIPLLLATRTAVRFISAEPLLEAVDFEGLWGYAGSARYEELARWPIHWVIVGGESGPNARRFEIEWARSIIKQCNWAGVPCFVKQLGSNPWDMSEDGIHDTWGPVRDPKGGDPDEWPDDLRVREYPTAASK